MKTPTLFRIFEAIAFAAVIGLCAWLCIDRQAQADRCAETGGVSVSVGARLECVAAKS